MATRIEDLHRTDIYAWTRDQAEALRRLADERWNGSLDLLNLTEEIEDVGNEILNGVLSQMTRVIKHLLKLEHAASPEPRRQWKLLINEARDQISRRLTSNIRRRVVDQLSDLYRRAARDARLELLDHEEREAAAMLPSGVPYTLDQILDEEWYPQNRHGHLDECEQAVSLVAAA